MITSSLSPMVQTFPMRDGLDGGPLRRLAFTFAFASASPSTSSSSPLSSRQPPSYTSHHDVHRYPIARGPRCRHSGPCCPVTPRLRPEQRFEAHHQQHVEDELRSLDPNPRLWSLANVCYRSPLTSARHGPAANTSFLPGHTMSLRRSSRLL